jgi:outer membrane protein TolC
MRWFVVVAFAASAATPLAAQAAPRLTLAEVYSRLDEHHPRIEAATARVAAARARVGPAGRWPDPAIQFALMNRSLPGFGLSDPLGMNQVQVMQMIPIAGKTGLSVRAARADADAEEAGAAEARLELRAEGAMLFYDLHAATDALETMTASRRLLTAALSASQTMYAEGRGRQTDALTAQVELARMDEERIRMRAMQQQMAAQLQALTGAAGDGPPPVPVLPHFPDSLPSRDSLTQLALANRPMLSAGSARVRAADALARRAGREIWPDITVGVIYGQRPMIGGGTDRMLSLMFGFTLPLSPGSKQGQMTAEARAMRAMSAADLEDMRTVTRSRIGVLAADYERARALRVLYQGTLLPELAAAAAAADAGYRAGTTPFMTLLESQMGVYRAGQELARLDADMGKALAELEMLTATNFVDLAPAAPAGGVQ